MIKSLGLDSILSRLKWTPTEAKSLVKDVNGEPVQEEFSYIGIVGMPLYLAGHTCPAIAYVVNARLVSRD